MAARKRAQVPSVDVLLGGYQVGQPSKASSLPTLDEYLFNPSSKVKKLGNLSFTLFYTEQSSFQGDTLCID